MSATPFSIEEFTDRFGVTAMHQAQARLTPALRTLHHRVLARFVDAGTAPSSDWLQTEADSLGLDPTRAVAALAESDLVHLSADHVAVAYPFSGTPTTHRVGLAEGLEVWAMCGGDALGIPLMVDRDATITTVDPYTAEPIRIRLVEGTWNWDPGGTVMLAAGTTGCSTAAGAVCRHINFFASASNAEHYLRRNANHLDGEIVDQEQAVEVARIVFGDLLRG